MSDDDYCITGKGVQSSPSHFDAAALQQMAIDDSDPVGAPIIRTDEVMAILQRNDRLSSGTLRGMVYGELESFLRLPGGYQDVPDLVQGLGPVAE
jgi:hypothetical protein